MKRKRKAQSAKSPVFQLQQRKNSALKGPIETAELARNSSLHCSYLSRPTAERSFFPPASRMQPSGSEGACRPYQFTERGKKRALSLSLARTFNKHENLYHVRESFKYTFACITPRDRGKKEREIERHRRARATPPGKISLNLSNMAFEVAARPCCARPREMRRRRAVREYNMNVLPGFYCVSRCVEFSDFARSCVFIARSSEVELSGFCRWA